VSPEYVERIRVEFEQLHQLVERRSALLGKVLVNAPTDIELDALATLLHSFYTGVEKILVILSKEMGEFTEIERGAGWHQTLLRALAEPRERRSAVLSRDLFSILLDYLGFRHVFRHAYTFELKWGRMRPLVVNLKRTMDRFEEEVRGFCDRRSRGG